MSDHLTISEFARRHGLAPRTLTDLFYRRVIPDDVAPITGGRRPIAPDQVDNVLSALRRAGKLPRSEAAAHA